QAQYESKFSRLWERYDEASHGNAEQMRDILEVTLDALESAERQIFKLEKLAEAESVGADKAAASGVEWMKRCLAAEKRIAELEAREVKLPPNELVTDTWTSPGDGWEVFDAQKVIDSIRSAGVRIAAGITVKGE
ncbi:hypothetical protein ABFJ38_004819, partial [Citrobacter freundii]